MFNFAPLGELVVFLLAIVIIIGGFFLIIVANIAYYLGLAIAAFLALCIVSWTIKWIWTGKSPFKFK